MIGIRDVVSRWLDVAMPHRQGTQIGRVLQCSLGGGIGQYSAQVRILRPGSLDDTDRILDAVPISPIWAGADGRGVYAPFPKDTLVLVDYIEHDPAHPFISGVWGEKYDAAAVEEGELTIIDGRGAEITISAAGLLRIASRQDSLRTVLEGIVDEIIAMQTVGSPPQHVVSPNTISKLEAAKAKIARVMEEV